MPHGGMWRWLGQMLFTACTGAGHAATERYRAFILYPASIRRAPRPPPCSPRGAWAGGDSGRACARALVSRFPNSQGGPNPCL
jgi:hypothetical protein